MVRMVDLATFIDKTDDRIERFNEGKQAGL